MVYSAYENNSKYTTSPFAPTLKAFEEHVQLRDLSDSTVNAYLSHISMLAEHYQQDPSTLCEEQVRAYFLFLRTEKRYKPTSMKQAKAAICSFYHGCLRIEPMWHVFSELKTRRRDELPVVISRKEVRRLLACVDDQKYHTILTLIYACGLRIGEACALEVTDVGTDAQRILIRAGKGGKSRFVPIAPEVIDLMREWWKTHRNPRFVFPSLKDNWTSTRRTPTEVRLEQQRAAMHAAMQPISTSAVRRALGYAVKASLLKQHIKPHTLRHCYATHLLEDGVGIRYISAYLGHASLNQTLVYAHLTTTGEVHTRSTLKRLYQTVIAPTTPEPRR